MSKQTDKKTQHITQFSIGNIIIGDAGLSSKDLRDGYIFMLCTIDNDNRFVDVAIKKDTAFKLATQILDELKIRGYKE